MAQEVARRQRAEERERALLDINNAIISNLTQDSLFQATFRALRRVMPVRSVWDFPARPGQRRADTGGRRLEQALASSLPDTS